jgi:hypothetical protein
LLACAENRRQAGPYSSIKIVGAYPRYFYSM